MPSGSKIAWLSVVLLCQVAPAEVAGCEADPKRRISVEETIRMTVFPETTYTAGDRSASRFARFSPDGKRFVVVTEKGHPETNENEFSLLLFETKDVFHQPKAKNGQSSVPYKKSLLPPHAPFTQTANHQLKQSTNA